MLPPKEAPATVFRKATAANHVDPFCRWLALWRWDASLKPRYEALVVGDPQMAAQKKSDTAAALALADQALDRLASIRPALDEGAYQFLRFRLEENRHHLVLFGHAAQAWLACLRLPHSDDQSALHQEIAGHLQAVDDEWQAHRFEAGNVIWPAGRTRYLQRGITLAMDEFITEMRRYAGMEA
jgi:hypothetical protein